MSVRSSFAGYEHSQSIIRVCSKTMGRRYADLIGNDFMITCSNNDTNDNIEVTRYTLTQFCLILSRLND